MSKAKEKALSMSNTYAVRWWNSYIHFTQMDYLKEDKEEVRKAYILLSFENEEPTEYDSYWDIWCNKLGIDYPLKDPNPPVIQYNQLTLF